MKKPIIEMHKNDYSTDGLKTRGVMRLCFLLTVAGGRGRSVSIYWQRGENYTILFTSGLLVLLTGHFNPGQSDL